MLYTVINATLIVALAATSVFCIVMYRELRKFKALSGEFATILRETSKSVDSVERAVASVHDDGATTLIALGERIDTAHQTLTSLRNAEAMAAAQLIRLQEKVEKVRTIEPEAPKAKTLKRQPEPKHQLEPEHSAGAEGEASMPTAAKAPRIRKTFEWPVVRSNSLTVQEA